MKTLFRSAITSWDSFRFKGIVLAVLLTLISLTGVMNKLHALGFGLIILLSRSTGKPDKAALEAAEQEGYTEGAIEGFEEALKIASKVEKLGAAVSYQKSGSHILQIFAARSADNNFGQRKVYEINGKTGSVLDLLSQETPTIKAWNTKPVTPPVTERREEWKRDDKPAQTPQSSKFGGFNKDSKPKQHQHNSGNQGKSGNFQQNKPKTEQTPTN